IHVRLRGEVHDGVNLMAVQEIREGGCVVNVAADKMMTRGVGGFRQVLEVGRVGQFFEIDHGPDTGLSECKAYKSGADKSCAARDQQRAHYATSASKTGTVDQFRSASATASCTSVIFTPARASLELSSTQFERGVRAA